MVSGPPLRRRYDLARRKVETDLDMKTAYEMSAKGSKRRSNGNRRIDGQTPFFRIAILSGLYFCISIVSYSQNVDDSDLTGSFGRHLGEYSINKPRKPRELSDFKNFVLEELAGQDLGHPKTDSKQRTFVTGTLSLVNGNTFRLKSAWLTLNKDGKYEWLHFVTETVNGEYFRFDGYFLRKRVDDVPNIDTYLRGTMQRFRNGKRLAKSNLPFTIYADH